MAPAFTARISRILESIRAISAPVTTVMVPASRVALLILIPVVGLWYTEARRSAATLPLGHQLPRIVTEAISGPPIEPGRTSRPVALVVVTASCPFCREQLSRWDTVGMEYTGRVDMLAISFSDRAVTEALMAGPHPYSVAHCNDARSWSEWRMSRVPAMFLLDPRGILIAQWTGLKPVEEERRMLQQLASLAQVRE